MRSLLAMLFAFSAALASAQTNVVSLIADTDFQRGIKTRHQQGVPDFALSWNKGAEPPVWDVAQHHSRSCVTNAAFQSVRAGGFTFKDEFAWLDFHPREQDADVILGLNGFREYDGKYRAAGDAWPHLYIEQRIANPHGHLGDAAPTIADMTRLDFSARVKLLYDRRHLGEGHNPSRHAGQYVFFFTVQNLTRKSPGYGDYYWFGILFYDDRKPLTELHAMLDKGSPKKKGTDKLIYDIGMKPFTSKIVADGEWVDVQGDLLPHILAGLREAWKQGYLPASQNLADYRVASVVIGWEIPGLNDAAVALKGLRATATLRNHL